MSKPILELPLSMNMLPVLHFAMELYLLRTLSLELTVPDFVYLLTRGINSQVRTAVITDRKVEIRPDPNCAFRTLIPAAEMLKDENLAFLIKNPTASCWIGHGGHVMAYPIRQGTLYNFVMCHPGSVSIGNRNETVSLDELKKKYRDWDPVLMRIIDKIPECLKWQNAEIEKLETWVSRSGKVVLMGDAAHAMVPYMAQA
jgi:salicylate hydroxylase